MYILYLYLPLTGPRILSAEKDETARRFNPDAHCLNSC